MRTIPQIHPETGVSCDYHNSLSALHLAINTYDRAWLSEILRYAPVLKYLERYSRSEYKNVITGRNRLRISRLDDIVDNINEVFNDPDAFEDQDLLDVINESQALIYGKTDYPETIEELRIQLDATS